MQRQTVKYSVTLGCMLLGYHFTYEYVGPLHRTEHGARGGGGHWGTEASV